jgi:hypothetical protein
LITITRRLALSLRSVFRRALGAGRGPGPAVRFAGGPEGLRVRARLGDVAVEYHAPGEITIETLWLPISFLADCEGKREEPVQLESLGEGRVMAQWRDGRVPQLVQYEAVEPPGTEAFPGLPEAFAENSPSLLAAIHDAAETVDPDSIRYALGCVQLQGASGRIVATDGRQLLVQGGFTFPWEGEILVPRTKAFASPELPRDLPVAVGRTDDWVVFRSGPWTLWLAVNKDGRFPNVEPHLPRMDAATARCQLSKADARFLAQTLPRLPGDEEWNCPVTVELNGHVAVRAKATGQPRPTEVVLRNSTWTGEAVRLNTNRRFLARAIRLGFEQVYCFGPRSPLACQEDRRTYVWALLEPDAAIKPAEDPIRLQSPEAGQADSTSNITLKRRIPPITEPAASASGPSKANGKATTAMPTKSPSEDFVDLIQETKVVRTALRDALGKTNELLTSLKRHRQRSRTLQNTLASLRQLKSLGG